MIGLILHQYLRFKNFGQTSICSSPIKPYQITRSASKYFPKYFAFNIMTSLLRFSGGKTRLTHINPYIQKLSIFIQRAFHYINDSFIDFACRGHLRSVWIDFWASKKCCVTKCSRKIAVICHIEKILKCMLVCSTFDVSDNSKFD